MPDEIVLDEQPADEEDRCISSLSFFEIQEESPTGNPAAQDRGGEEDRRTKKGLGRTDGVEKYPRDPGPHRGDEAALHTDLPGEVRPPQDSWLEFLEEQYLQSFDTESTKIDQLFAREMVRSRARDWGEPVYVAIRRKSTQAILTAVFILCLYLGLYACFVVTNGKNVLASEVVMEVLELQDKHIPLTLTNSFEVEILTVQCDSASSQVAQSATATIISFENPVHITGFQWTFSGADPDLDPALFRISTRHQNKTTQLARTDFRLGITQRQRSSLLWQLSGRTEEEDAGAVRELGITPPVAHTVGQIVLSVVLAVGAVGTVLLARRSALLEARVALGSAVAGAGVTCAAVTVVVAWGAQPELALSWLRGAVSSALFLPAIASNRHSSTVPAFLFASLLHLTLFLVEAFCLAPPPRSSLPLSEEPLLCLLAAALALSLVLQRSTSTLRLQAVQDIVRHEAAVWEGECAALGEGRHSVLIDLADALSRAGRGRDRRPTQAVLWERGGRPLSRPASHLRSPGRSSVVKSLDQLYAQARGCSRLLRSKVAALGAASAAVVPVTPRKTTSADPDPIFVSWAAAQEDEELRASVQWTPLKDPRQAVLKALQLYAGDASNLSDLCREALLFPHPAGMTECLLALMRDPDIEIEQVKSNLRTEAERVEGESEEGEAVLIKGVVVKLRVVSEAARGLWLDGHVCELQLIPLAVARSMSEEQTAAVRAANHARALRPRHPLHSWPSLGQQLWRRARALGRRRLSMDLIRFSSADTTIHAPERSVSGAEAGSAQHERGLGGGAWSTAGVGLRPGSTRTASTCTGRGPSRTQTVTSSRDGGGLSRAATDGLRRLASDQTRLASCARVSSERHAAAAALMARCLSDAFSPHSLALRGTPYPTLPLYATSTCNPPLLPLPHRYCTPAPLTYLGPASPGGTTLLEEEGEEEGSVRCMWGEEGRGAGQRGVGGRVSVEQVQERSDRGSEHWQVQATLDAERAASQEQGAHRDGEEEEPRLRPWGLRTQGDEAWNASSEEARAREGKREEAREREGAAAGSGSARGSRGRGAEAGARVAVQAQGGEEGGREGERELPKSDGGGEEVRGGGRMGWGGRSGTEVEAGSGGGEERAAHGLGGRAHTKQGRVTRRGQLQDQRSSWTASSEGAGVGEGERERGRRGSGEGWVKEGVGRRPWSWDASEASPHLQAVPQTTPIDVGLMGSVAGGAAIGEATRQDAVPEEEGRKGLTDSVLSEEKRRRAGGAGRRLSMVTHEPLATRPAPHKPTWAARMLQLLAPGEVRGESSVYSRRGWPAEERRRFGSSTRPLTTKHRHALVTQVCEYPGRGSGEWFDLMERLYKQRVTGTQRELDQRGGFFSTAMKEAGQLAVFSTASPVAAALSKSWCRWVCVLVGVLALLAATLASHRLASLGSASTTAVAFLVARPPRSAAPSPPLGASQAQGNATAAGASETGAGAEAGGAGVRVKAWGYLSGDCRLEFDDEPEQVAQVEGGWRYEFRLERAEVVNGVWWRAWEETEGGGGAEGGDEGTAVRVLEVEVLEEGEGEEEGWRLLGTGEAWLGVAGQLHWRPAHRIQTRPRLPPKHPHQSLQRQQRAGAQEGEEGGVEVLDLRVPWMPWCDGPGSWVVCACTWFGLALCGAVGRLSILLQQAGMRGCCQGVDHEAAWLHTGRPVLAVGLGLTATVHLVSVTAGQLRGFASDLATRWIVATLHVLQAFVVAVRPQLVVEAIGLGELSKAAVKCAMDESVREGRWEHLLVSLVLGIGGGGLLVLIRWSRYRSHQEVQADVAAYDQAWCRLMDSTEARGDLERINEACELLASHANFARGRRSARPRQRLRVRKATARGYALRRGKKGWAAQVARAASGLASPIPSLRRGLASPTSSLRPGLGSPSSSVRLPSPSPARSPMPAEALQLADRTRLSLPAAFKFRWKSPTSPEQRLDAFDLLRRRSFPALSRGDSRGNSPGIRRALTARAPPAGSQHVSFPRMDSSSVIDAFSATLSVAASNTANEAWSYSKSSAPTKHEHWRVRLLGCLPVRARPRARMQQVSARPSNHSSPPTSLCRDHSGEQAAFSQGSAGVDHLSVSPSLAPAVSLGRSEDPLTSAHGAHELEPESPSAPSIARVLWGSFKLSRLSGGALARPPPPSTDRGFTAREVARLDELFLQAGALHPILQRKAQELAMLSGGCFVEKLEDCNAHAESSKGRHNNTAKKRFQIRPWEELRSEKGSLEAAEKSVKWAQLKGPERAIEKLVRSYEGKVSRLLDVCRQSLIFETPGSLAVCLNHIAQDPDIACMAVRNRFHANYDANHMSLGYRDVNLNVRMTSAACRRLGLDLHVCEIQLLLKDFAAVKLERGHKRYVAFRNARGQ